MANDHRHPIPAHDAIRLVLIIEENPETNPERIELCDPSREQLNLAVADLDELYAEVLNLAARVSNAALKHTAGPERHNDRQAVGRLHNAAKHARKILDERCPECRKATAAGVGPMSRDGKCVCGRLLGDLNAEVAS